MLKNRLNELGEEVKHPSETDSPQSTKRVFDQRRLHFENRVEPIVDWWSDDQRERTSVVRRNKSNVIPSESIKGKLNIMPIVMSNDNEVRASTGEAHRYINLDLIIDDRRYRSFLHQKESEFGQDRNDEEDVVGEDDVSILFYSA